MEVKPVIKARKMEVKAEMEMAEKALVEKVLEQVMV